ncbi:MAG: eL32 family ribosomal protein [Candidatus Diapherotrites archaeon]|nr:eL32 family ribosomal protein [Candidatus Diapherotrites archaeon]MDZ4256014.1 eL32 family ribosomal protein [archaeon]
MTDETNIPANSPVAPEKNARPNQPAGQTQTDQKTSKPVSIKSKSIGENMSQSETKTAIPEGTKTATDPAKPTLNDKKELKKGAKKDEKLGVEKTVKKKGKKDAWVKKEKVRTEDTIKAIQGDLIGKWKPVFWGRFGKKNLRTRNNPKFDKWRKPRGIDILRRKDDGAYPQTGYRMPKTIRGKHPSGYDEVRVATKKELDSLGKTQAARIAATVGRKKRIQLITYANEKKIKVLN